MRNMKPLNKCVGLLERTRRLEVHVRALERNSISKKRLYQMLYGVTKRIDDIAKDADRINK